MVVKWLLNIIYWKVSMTKFEKLQEALGYIVVEIEEDMKSYKRYENIDADISSQDAYMMYKALRPVYFKLMSLLSKNFGEESDH